MLENVWGKVEKKKQVHHWEKCKLLLAEVCFCFSTDYLLSSQKLIFHQSRNTEKRAFKAIYLGFFNWVSNGLEETDTSRIKKARKDLQLLSASISGSSSGVTSPREGSKGLLLPAVFVIFFQSVVRLKSKQFHLFSGLSLPFTRLEQLLA